MFFDRAKWRGLLFLYPLRTLGAPYLARTPDFLPCCACCGHGCGFLLKESRRKFAGEAELHRKSGVLGRYGIPQLCPLKGTNFRVCVRTANLHAVPQGRLSLAQDASPGLDVK
jgi:hypothetical protein